MKSIGSPLTCERPTKALRLETLSQWDCLPTDLFIEIFEQLKRMAYHAKISLPHLCAVCRHWTYCGASLRLKLANVAELSMHVLFGQNAPSTINFIEIHSNKLTFIDLSENHFEHKLPYTKLTQLQKLTLLTPTSHDLQQIKHLPRLNSLCFKRVHFPADEAIEIIECIADITSLKEINIQWPSPKFIAKRLHLLTNLTNLRSFNTRISPTDAGLDSLSLFTQLTGLEMFVTDDVKIERYNHLSTLTTLRQINIDARFNNVEGCPSQLPFIQSFTNLERLRLSWFNLNNYNLYNFLQPLSALTNLLTLELGDEEGCELETREELQFLTALTQLQELTLEGFGDIEIYHLLKLPNLKKLNANSLIEEEMPQLSALTNLENLHLSLLENIHFGFLKNLTKLEKLSLHGAADLLVTLDGVEAINTLTKLNLSGRFDPTYFAQLSSLRLESLQLCSFGLNASITFRSLPSFTTLRSLRFFSDNANLTRAISPEFMQQLAKITTLEHLSIYPNYFTQEEILCLTSLEKLCSLELTVNGNNFLSSHLYQTFPHMELLRITHLKHPQEAAFSFQPEQSSSESDSNQESDSD